MKQVAKFEKVSFEQFKKDYSSIFDVGESQIKEIYDSIQLPKRATKGSAGYDFFTPIDIQFEPNKRVKIPTGIRVSIEQGWVLQVFPRSSLGFKYGLRLSNTVGIIDSDYYYSDNEGHIFMSLICDEESFTIKKNQGMVQGIFTPYGVTTDDNEKGLRNGGLGSTTK